MTDDARSIIRAFSDAPVMKLLMVTTMTGLSEYTTRFILEQLRQVGLVLDRHERWSITKAAGKFPFDNLLRLKLINYGQR